jgi:hypothetical protein
MRTRLICAAAIAACIPAVVFAQRTRGSDPSGPTSGAMAPPAASSAAKAPTSRDIADLNPASLLISKRKKASLADSTVAQLKVTEQKIKDRNAPFFVTYDSIYKWTVPLTSSGAVAAGAGMHGGVGDNTLSTSTSSQAEQTKMQASMRDLRALMADYRERRKTDVADVLAVIPDAQKKPATDLLNSQDSDVEKLLNPRP